LDGREYSQGENMDFDKQKTLNLLAQYNLTRSVHLRNQIALANQGLVRKAAFELNKGLKNIDFDDLFQVGFIGLIKSIERYNSQVSPSFSCYAMPFIRGEILHYIRDKNNTIRLSRTLSDFRAPSRKVIETLTLRLGRTPSQMEISEGLGISLNRWLEIRKAFYECNMESLNLKINTLGDHTSELLDFTIDESQVHKFEVSEELTDVMTSIEQLSSDRRRSIEYHYLQNLSRKDTATQMRVSPMTVTRYLDKGVAELKVLLDVRSD
jgi:RNA polymerase sigma-B factor